MVNFLDYICEEKWENYSQEDHALWRKMYDRQLIIFEGRVAQEHIDSLKRLNISREGIPKFHEISALLKKESGWEVVPVTGLVPGEMFFKLLQDKKFPSTCFIRRPDQIDYLQEPDVFHDIFGHVPLLVLPVFANYMQAFATLSLKALSQGELKRAERLYWFTIEFGLIQTNLGLRTYGAGIVSSYKETIYCVEDPAPIRLPFSLERIMRTDYRIDDIQKNYFVIESYEELFKSTLQDPSALLQKVTALDDIPAGVLLPGEKIIAPHL